MDLDTLVFLVFIEAGRSVMLELAESVVFKSKIPAVVFI